MGEAPVKDSPSAKEQDNAKRELDIVRVKENVKALVGVREKEHAKASPPTMKMEPSYVKAVVPVKESGCAREEGNAKGPVIAEEKVPARELGNAIALGSA